MGSLQTSIPALVEALLPFLPALRAKAEEIPDWIRAIAARLLPRIEAEKGPREALKALEAQPSDEDVRGAFRLALRKFFEKHPGLDADIARLLGPRNTAGPAPRVSIESLDRSDETLRRLEMVRLLRQGVPAADIARQYKTDAGFVFHLNAAFTAQGVLGIAAGMPARRWLDQLRRDDPLLRRLEMVRLLRSGVPIDVVAAEFNAVPEYVQRQAERFDRDGSAGLVGEAEARRYHELHPPVLRVASYNLHGVHDQDDGRYRLIARELSAFEPDLVAFQEVINGGGVRDTSVQLAQKMSAMAGANYRSFFAHCHMFRETFPEGVAVVSRYPLMKPTVIDLTEGLESGLRPSMPRFAAACAAELPGRTVAFASTHLDHGSAPEVRKAQARKLAGELDRLYPEARLFLIAGDMNDIEGSSAIAFFAQAGYVDAYRACNRSAGATFTTVDPHARIDFILAKGAGGFVSAQTALAHPSLSDHLGVFAVMR